MPSQKQANTEAMWSLLNGLVANARVESHRMRHLVNRGLAIIENDTEEQREHLYQKAGDLIVAIPERLGQLESLLDQANYALAKLEQDFLKSRVSQGVKKEIDEVMTPAIPVPAKQAELAQRIASRWEAQAAPQTTKQADYMPPLGRPGGPCHVVKRIVDKVHNPSMQHELVDDVERGLDLNNQDASKVYPLDVEMGGGIWRKMFLMSHSQYRMDLRGIGVQQIQKSLGDLSTEMQRNPRLMAEVMSSGSSYRWDDPKRKLTVVLQSQGRDAVRIITVYPTGQSDPRAPGEGGCEV